MRQIESSYREGPCLFFEVAPDCRIDLEQVNVSPALHSRGFHSLLSDPPPIVKYTYSISVLQLLMDPELKRRLQTEFALQIERLGHIIGRDLSHWSQAHARERS